MPTTTSGVAMATNAKGTGMGGYNVQAAVDAKHHLIIAHEVTNVGHDRSQLANKARQAKAVTGSNGLTVLADRGYFFREEVVACEAAGVTPIVPKPLTSGARADGRFGKQGFIYQSSPHALHQGCVGAISGLWRVSMLLQSRYLDTTQYISNWNVIQFTMAVPEQKYTPPE